MKNIKPIDVNVQKNTFGGSVSLPMNPLYLTKTACEIKAADLILKGSVTGMTAKGIAKEIFAHACCYYGASVVKALGVDSDVVDDIYSRANPVDIEDGGDTAKRQVAYELIWTLSPSIVYPYLIEEN